MSNNYEKKYDIGNISLDLPRANFIHELPLLSFSDVQNSINLSLVFNYARHEEDIAENKNSFFIAPGFKLNMQKKLVFDENYDLSKIYESDGKFIELKTNEDMVNIFTFDDDSQRILRRISQSTPTPVPPGSNEIVPETGITTYTHVVEYPDFSKEVYDSNGKIIEVYDKYSDTPYLTYAYNEYSRLTSISYKGTKVISLSYESNRLNTVTYNNCSSTFNYNTDGTLSSIEHYTGVVYSFDFTNGYKIEAKKDENAVINSSDVNINDTNKTISISDHYGNTVTYKFDNMTPTLQNKIVEITDNFGVKTRVQFNSSKMTYSYEIGESDAEFVDDQYVGSINVYRTEDSVYSSQTAYTKKYSDGELMTYIGNNMWKYGTTAAVVNKGYYIVSGWIKQTELNIPNNSKFVRIGVTENDPGVSCFAGGISYNKWAHFAFKVPSESNSIYVLFSGSGLEVKDVKITFQRTHVRPDETSSYVPIYEDVLIHKTDGSAIPLHQIYFSAYGYDPESDWSSFDDILRYLVNKKKNENTYEFYYSKSKTVVPIIPSNEIKFGYRSEEDAETYLLNDYYLGKKRCTNKGIVTTRVKDNESDCFLLYETVDESGNIISLEKYNSNLDVFSTTVEGVTTTYERNSQGLVTKETVSGLYRYDTSYTDSFITMMDIDPDTEQTISTTKYYLNSTWGGINKVEVIDGNNTVSVITDTYTSDMSVLKQKTFGVNPTSTNAFTYSNGKLNSMTHGNLNYCFGYTSTKGELESVSKNGTSIEHHTYEESNGETTVTSKYPNSSSSLYTKTQIFDKYGKLKSINNALDNTYCVDSYFFCVDDSNEGAVVPLNEYDRAKHGDLIYGNVDLDRKDAVLAQTTDYLSKENTKYGYDNGMLAAAVTRSTVDSSLLRQELFYYDHFKRLNKDKYEYDILNSESVESEITYVDDITTPTADSRVKTYTFKRNGYRKSQITNTYDAYKRIQQKKYHVGKAEYIKSIEYDNTRPSSVVDKRIMFFGDDIILNNAKYEYDALGRITCEKDGSNNVVKRYSYDTYGQLTREDNAALDKTYVYEYNGIGNVTSVKSYAYTTGELSGTPGTTSFSYSGDKLTSFGSKAITYNSNGGVSSYDGWTYNWSNGRLSGLMKNIGSTTRIPSISSSKSFAFTYNAFGQRTGVSYNYFISPSDITPVVDTEVISYNKEFGYDSAGRLIFETTAKTFHSGATASVRIVFLYDESSMVGFEYITADGNNIYYYLRNLQGDVIGIYDSFGTNVAEYNYDAWGNCTINSTTTNYTIAHANPIRYRGYYYDVDTGLYYLNSRYYNPQWRRFISPDDSSYLDPETPNGLNLYCYCNNDPVNYKDPSGRLAITTIAIITGAIIGFGISATSSIVTQLEEYNGDWSKVNPLEVFYDGAFGAINGGLAASGIGIVASALFGGALGFVSSIGKDFLFEEDRNINWLGAVNSLFIGVLAGLIAGSGANYAKDGMQIVKFGNSREILRRTITNGTQRAIARQTHAMNVHATKLLISGIRYMLSNTFSISYTMFTN